MFRLLSFAQAQSDPLQSYSKPHWCKWGSKKQNWALTDQPDPVARSCRSPRSNTGQMSVSLGQGLGLEFSPIVLIVGASSTDRAAVDPTRLPGQSAYRASSESHRQLPQSPTACRPSPVFSRASRSSDGWFNDWEWVMHPRHTADRAHLGGGRHRPPFMQVAQTGNGACELGSHWADEVARGGFVILALFLIGL